MQGTSIEARVRYLENQLAKQRGRGVAWAALAGALAVTTLGFSFGAVRGGALQVDPGEIVVRYPSGKRAFSVVAEEEGVVTQVLYGRNERERVKLSIDKLGASRVQIIDERGTARVGGVARSEVDPQAPRHAALYVMGQGTEAPQIYMDEIDGEVAFKMRDRKNQVRATIGIARESDAANMSVWGSGGDDKSSVSLWNNGDGSLGYGMRDKAGVARSSVWANADGRVAADLFDEAGVLRMRSVTMRRPGNDLAAAVTLDGHGKMRLFAGTSGVGDANLTLADSKEQTRISQYVAAAGVEFALMNESGGLASALSVGPDGTLKAYPARAGEAQDKTWFDNYQTARGVLQMGTDAVAIYKWLTK